MIRVLKHILNPFMAHDAFAKQNNQYLIQSLYFDDDYDSALVDKLDGIESRQKIRLRVYNQDPSIIKLESKYKYNQKVNKQVVAVSEQTALKLIQNPSEISIDSSMDTGLAQLISTIQNRHLTPKIIVTYRREAFTFPVGQTRISIDSQLRFSSFADPYFYNDRGGRYLFDSNLAILEIKYDDFLPEVIRDLLVLENSPGLALSKYAMCRLEQIA